ncbi:hypothetical protein LHJ74_14835 [Streptomyces sp. N2-109]|uniref:Uncharacterized protein n=1 Tax=Streptomyces gossypii TaxID=2883101 RepID=A0ABT2JTZ6_9ACTN|nr:hypothetical protein [Streptomyces gossypii]MCT2591168.1 hypothetical protein [Streptomyces gossypii]
MATADPGLLRCTAADEVHPPPQMVPLLDSAEPGWALCELAEDHDDRHATFICDLKRPGPELTIWWMWGPGGGEFVMRHPCPGTTTGDESGDACTLFHAHPSGHSWQVTDPTMEALRQELATRGPIL